VNEQLESFDSITAADVDEFAAEWLAAAQIFVLVSGNLLEAEARDFCGKVALAFQLKPLPAAHVPSQRCVLVPADRLFVRQQLARNPDESNSAVLNVYQIGPATDDLEAHLTLLAHILSDALFDQLRTKETLSYLVQGFQGRLTGVLHYQIAVQSSDADGAYLDHRVEAFLAWFRSFKLADLIRETGDFIDQNKKAVIANLTEKDKNIGDTHNRHWGEIEKVGLLGQPAAARSIERTHSIHNRALMCVVSPLCLLFSCPASLLFPPPGQGRRRRFGRDARLAAGILGQVHQHDGTGAPQNVVPVLEPRARAAAAARATDGGGGGLRQSESRPALKAGRRCARCRCRRSFLRRSD
jgi:hypothetical protein